MRRIAAFACLIGLALTSRAAARPWTVDDLFHLEDIGQAEFDPSGRYLMVERLRPRAELTAFDMGNDGEIARRRPVVFDLAAGGAPHPLLPVEPGAGYALGAISPDGRQVVVYRLRDHIYTLGVVEIATGKARWLNATPESGVWGRTVEWVSSTRLVAVVRPDNSLPLAFRQGLEAPQILSALSRKQAQGRQASVIAVGSGQYKALRPHAAPDRLVAFDLQSQTHRVLATGDFFDLAISADQRFVALLSNGADIQYPDAQTMHVGAPAFRRSLTVVDLHSGQVREPVSGYDVLSHLLAWAPNSDRLLVYGRKGDAAWADGNVLQVDAVRGTVEAISSVVASILDDTGGIPVAEADWDGDSPLLYGHARGKPADRPDWFRLTPAGPKDLTAALPASPRLLTIGSHGLIFGAKDQFWQSSGAGQLTELKVPPRAEVLTLHAPDEGARFGFNNRPRRDWILIRTGEGERQVIQRIGPGPAAPIGLGDAEHARATDATGDRIVAVERDARGVLTLELLGRLHPLAPRLRLNTDLAEIDPAVVKAVPHLSGDGRPIRSWLYLPPRRPPGGKPPLLVWAYPGEAFDRPPEAFGPGLSDAPHALANPQVLAGHGYAVLVVSLPPRPDLADPADGFEPDIVRAVDAAGETGLVDTARLALWGHSYGGYAALEVATRTSRFKAIIASAAASDLATVESVFSAYIRYQPADGLWIDTRAGWLEDGQAQLHTQAWVNPELYVRRSPVFSAGAVKSPLLLITGGMDPATAPEQSEEMFSALYRQRKTAILAAYVGEQHLIYSPANLRDVYARVFRFLDENLGPDPPRTGS